MINFFLHQRSTKCNYGFMTLVLLMKEILRKHFFENLNRLVSQYNKKTVCILEQALVLKKQSILSNG